MSEIQKQLENDLALYYASPASVMYVTLDAISAVFNGELDIVDATNPFMMLLEASATHAHGAMMKMESLSSEMYPVLAKRYSDLYRHMSNADYTDRFATPTKTSLTMLMPIDTLKRFAVLDVATSISRILIPGDTTFNVAGYSLYTGRGINILVLPNGVVQAAYAIDDIATVSTDTGNIVDYKVINDNGTEKLMLTFPVEQITVESIENPVSNSTGFSIAIPFTDSFYKARAYHKISGVWVEMHTTHTDQVYDSSKPTLLLEVDDDLLQCRLPEIYINNGTIGDTIRVDVFTTKGNVVLDLSEYSSDDYSGQWTDLNNPTDIFIQPMSEINDIVIFGTSTSIPGRDALSVSELTERVIYRAEDVHTAVTFENITNMLKDNGFDLNTAKDTITERRYICSRKLPQPENTTVSSPIAVAHASVTINTNNTDYDYCIYHNGNRSTLTPVALYKEIGEDVILQDLDNFNIVEGLDPRSLSRTLNTDKYLYNPFFYVLDTTSDVYNTRIYYLDDAVEISRDFVAANPGLSYVINTESIAISREDNVFSITLRAKGPAGLSDVYGQLTYTDVSGARYYMSIPMSVVSDGIVEGVFALHSNMDINEYSRIAIDNLLDTDSNTSTVYVDLLAMFDIHYMRTSAVPVASLMDPDVYTFGLPTISVTTNERSRILLGKYLPKLYGKARAKVTPAVYALHTADVYLLHTEEVFERDVNGYLLWTVDIPTNKPVFQVVHAIGDPVLDVDGNPVYSARIGDVMLDTYGNPIIAAPESVVWEVEPVLFDARYRYATESTIVEYRDSIPKTIIDYIENGVEPIVQDLLARTDMDFQPTATASRTRAIVDRTQTVVLDTALSFAIRYTLTKHAITDSVLKAQLVEAAKAAILEELTASVISMGNLTDRLMVVGGDSVVSVQITNPILGYDVAEIQDDNVRFSIRSEIRYRSDGRLGIEDDFVVTFI